MKKLSALLVDDREEFATALSQRLTLHGMDVETANSGEDALGILKEKAIDVVVLDVIMPGMGGLELLERIKTTNPDIRVILLTGHGSTKEGIEGMRLGAFDFLTKPVDLEELITKMKTSMQEMRKE
jgi:DNA-binding NtrC family response regulator